MNCDGGSGVGIETILEGPALANDSAALRGVEISKLSSPFGVVSVDKNEDAFTGDDFRGRPFANSSIDAWITAASSSSSPELITSGAEANSSSERSNRGMAFECDADFLGVRRAAMADKAISCLCSRKSESGINPRGLRED